MKIELAYSLDCDEFVNAEEAYDLFWHGKIKDKRNFECRPPSCTVQITCANLDKKRNKMKVLPYFKAFGEHSDDCELMKEVKTIHVKERKSLENPSERGFLDQDFADIFELSRPGWHYEQTKKTKVNNETTGKTVTVKRGSSIGPQEAKKKSSTYHHIRRFIEKYFEYRAKGFETNRFIEIKGYKVSYGEMFIEIEGQDISQLSDYPRIYFGKAFVNKSTDGSYNLKFSKKLVYEGQCINPRVFVGKDLLDRAHHSKLNLERFEELCTKNYPAVYCFVYSKPLQKESKGKTYINFNISKMDFFEIKDEIDF